MNVNFGLVKLVAFGLMLADHSVALLCPGLSGLRVYTHQAFPLFASSVAYAWSDLTADRSAYLGRILLLASASQLPFSLAFPGRLNVLFVFVLGLLLARLRGWLAVFSASAVFLLCCVVPTDGGPFGVLAVCFAARRSWLLAALCHALVLLPAGVPCSALAVASVVIFGRSGRVSWKPGAWSRSRLWYWFYPAHLAFLWLVSRYAT